MYRFSVFIIAFAIVAAAGSAMGSYRPAGETDTLPFFPGGTYDESITTPHEHFGDEVFIRPVEYESLVDYIHIVAEQSPRLAVRQHGYTHEEQPLHHVIVTSQANHASLDEHRSTLARLADPRLDPPVTDTELEGLPASAWLGYSIHGDEISGTDAALRLIYQLAAGTDEETTELLDNAIIVVDPCENPDGRRRYLSMLQTYRSEVPNYNPSAMQHSGVWPWGRSNHYWFDLNRDWIIAAHPETQGRLATILTWHPQLIVDGHEMGANATFMSDPPREPINYNTPDNVRNWWPRFNEDMAESFDRRGWPHYTMEWHDQWYPGFGSAWGTFHGAIGMLYEQAGVDGGAIRQRDGYMLTYHEAINHQFQASWANLNTLVQNRAEILQDYRNTRREMLERGRESNETYIIVPGSDRLRTEALLHSLMHQGIEVQRALEEFSVDDVTSSLGEEANSRTFPAGSYLVSTAQPMGNLVRTIMEFDPHLNLEFLEDERKELEKYGHSKMYEISTWCLPLAYDVETWLSTHRLRVSAERLNMPLIRSPGKLHNPEAQFGFVADMVGEATNRLLAYLFGKDLTVYATTEPFTIEGQEYSRGALLVRRQNNPDNLAELLGEAAGRFGIDIHGVNTAVATSGPYLGAPSFRVLKKPRVALCIGDGMDYTSCGTVWFALDQEVGLRHSLVEISRLNRTDLGRYNVIVIPSSWGGVIGSILGGSGARRLSDWVSDGGLLVLIGSSATWAADSSNGLSQARLMRQTLDELAKYEKRLSRELAAEEPDVDTMALWHPEKVSEPEEPEQEEEKGAVKPDEETDRWMRRFHPRGAILKGIVDTEDWLAFGVDSVLPLMAYTRSAVLASSPVDAVVRYEPDENDLRLSGLLWPEGRSRWAGTVWASRERKGQGQVIMFTGAPNFRAYWWGSRQMLLNAVLYGPGMAIRGGDY